MDSDTDRLTSFRFYLGTHQVAWLERLDVPLFVSRRRLVGRKTLPSATTGWALDSGGFTELDLYGEWKTTPTEYVADVERFDREIGRLEWVAPQDWMCEPFMLAKTRLSIADHQRLTVENLVDLRGLLDVPVIPVLQGWTLDDYRRCWDAYEQAGVSLEDEPLVGLGSVCRRQDTLEAAQIVRGLQPLRLHYFGAKMTGLSSFGDALASADSLAWSYRARRDDPLPGCSHKSCSSCSIYALRWRERLLSRLDQLTLEVPA